MFGVLKRHISSHAIPSIVTQAGLAVLSQVVRFLASIADEAGGPAHVLWWWRSICGVGRWTICFSVVVLVVPIVFAAGSLIFVSVGFSLVDDWLCHCVVKLSLTKVGAWSRCLKSAERHWIRF